MKTQELRYFLYARRSKAKTDKEENVVSVESQILEMEEVAKRNNLNIVKTFRETKSAKQPFVRPVFQEMIDGIRKGKADGILVWKMDRLARNPVDEGTIKYLLQEGVLKNIKSTDRDWFPDDNVLMASVEFGVATQYSRDLSKHVKRGLTAKVNAGHRPGLAPLGYLNSHYRDKGKEEVLVDEERFPLVRKIFDLMLTGRYSVLELVKTAEKIGLSMRSFRGTKNTKRMCKSNMYSLLTTPFYYGEFEYPISSGNWYQGMHKPMLTKEEYDKIQTILGKRGKPRPRTHKFAYTGLMKCEECGARITAEEKWKYQKNGKVHHYIYYHCTKKIDKNCTQKAVREEDIERDILDFLKRINIPTIFHEWAISTLKEMHEEERKDRNQILYQKRKEYDNVVSRLDKLMEMRLNNEISPIEFSDFKVKLESQKNSLKKFLDGIDERIDGWMKEVEKAFNLAEKAESEFTKGDLEKKKEILSALGYNHLLKDKKLNILAEKPIYTIEKMASEVKRISDRLEPPKNVEEQQQIKQNYDENPLLCGIAESNRSPQFGKLLFYR